MQRCFRLKYKILAVLSAALLAGCGGPAASSDHAGWLGKPMAAAGDALSGLGHMVGVSDHASRPPGDMLPYDGDYQGRAVLTQGGATCPRDSYGVVSVGDNILSYAYAPGVAFVVPVAADGVLVGKAGAASLTGRIKGGRLEMRVRDGACATRMVAWATGNRS